MTAILLKMTAIFKQNARDLGQLFTWFCRRIDLKLHKNYVKA